MLELRICPGIHQAFRLALVEDDSFTTLSEHDTPAQAVAAREKAEAAASDAVAQLERIAA